ncbi:Uu.00g089660.m01.CDS01 [Anthostomella pinea]|uniref:Probable methionine--tRNA ligase, mitochondrial n=1 Tax=Anthostomella pinea TaxID=933095 RepID=A0AAI8VNX7_9PEZI|nr:Uu.00g089660.m01.CDS01 [Anthostomella pinea]
MRMRMRFSSSSSSSSPALRRLEEKPYYVTTPIFYVNASPHVGHLYSMLIADVLKRWEVLKGRQAYLSTGTDEHGMKVQRAAELQDVPPKALCDTNAETFKDLARRANISNDHFIRTTDPEHRDAVEYFWARLRDSGYIYETKHEGWYCVSDETFYPESVVEKRVSPLTGKSYVASVETGNAVEWTEEKNYHFRLTAFRDRLLRFYMENPAWVVPESRFVEVIDWVRNNLEDLSISRPVSRLDWGIPVPDDPSQTIYVWVDALVNYLTTAGYPIWPPGSEHDGGWPADVHVVGKDIIRFHCIYWPAFLMALNIELPRQVLSHGHWLMSKQKMSKSKGNVVNPFFALDRWGVDTMRYFLIHGGQVANDSDYDNSSIVDKYKKGLQGGLGNLLNRITRPTAWSVREAVQAKAANKSSVSLLAVLVQTHRDQVDQQVQKADAHMKALNPGGALKEIMELVYATNRFLHNTAPWDKRKEGDTEAVNQIIYHAADSLRVVGILLQPFMPEKAALLLDRLGVGEDRRGFGDAKLDVDEDYGTPVVPVGAGAQSSLFPPLPVED